MEDKYIFKTKQKEMQSQPIQIRWGIFQGGSLSPLLFCTSLIANIPGGYSFVITHLYSTYCEHSRRNLFRHYSTVQHLMRIFQGDSLSPLLFCTALIANIPGGLYFATILLYSTYCEYSSGTLFHHYYSVKHLLH